MNKPYRTFLIPSNSTKGLGTIMAAAFSLKFVKSHASGLAILAAMVAGWSAPVAAQSDDATQIDGPSGSYFCSLTDAEEVIDGRPTHRAMDDYRGPPFQADYPVTENRETITAEGYADADRYYWYIKTQPTDYGTYTIHGVFDFEAKTLSTSRSLVANLERGGVGAIGGSFYYLCESVERQSGE